MSPSRPNRKPSEKFPNEYRPPAFFMLEGLRVAAGQVIVNQAIELARTREDLLEAAVRDHARLVYRIAYSVLRNHHDAEDATQETFVRVVRARTKLAKVADVRNWLARIAWRVAVECRKKSSQVLTEEIAVDHLAGQEIQADELVLGREMSEILECLIPSLPPKLRDAVTLSTVEEMSPADVAQVLGINEAKVRSRLFRARQVLREKLTALLEGKHGRER
jgi:RNA polymerase sigma-70 factor (ECF subfamily)